MNRFFTRIVIGTLLISCTAVLLLILYVQFLKYKGRRLFDEVKDYPKGYIYKVNDNHRIIPVSYVSVSDVADTTLLTLRYSKSKEDTSIIPSNYYIIRYQGETFFRKISANIYQFTIIEKECWGYLQGYIYKDFFIPEAPSNSQIDDWESFPKLMRRKGISSFGIQCR